jgi:hypothetical protein
MFSSQGNVCYHTAHYLLSSCPSKNVKIKVYRSIILPVISYAHKTWSVTLREEHRLRVFDNRVLKGIFGPKRDEVEERERKLRNFYSSKNILKVIKSRKMRRVEHLYVEKEKRIKILAGKHKRKKSWVGGELFTEVVIEFGVA